MKNMELNKALKIGSTCIITYIVNYFLRNVLGVLTPQMLQTGLFTKEWIGALSSAYMLFYAIGQLTNGFLGDRISPRNMIVTGLTVTGTASIIFPFVPYFVIQVLCFGVFGYGLSMMRGPMMKMIAENTKENYARVICAFFSSAGFLGAFVAGVYAALFKWNGAFVVAGITSIILAIVAYTVIFRMEKQNLIKTASYGEALSKKDFFGAFKADKFVFFMIISMIIEITTTSINFWIPTYLTENLGLSNNTANTVYIIKNIIRAFSPFMAIMIYERCRDEMKILKYSFLASALILLGMLFVKNVWLNIFIFIVSLFIAGFAAAVLWSIYIPSLKKTGKVSSANGILDCSGYIGAATSNMIFASFADRIGWNGIIVMWAGIIFAGFIATLIEQKLPKYN